MSEIVLAGCTPEPLMAYLKALGVFRLVAEDAEHGDPAVRGWWADGQFHIDTTLSRDELEQFFRELYRPTPVVGPWGGRSGFYPDDSEATARRALDVISCTAADRFLPFREAIDAVRRILSRLGLREKEEVSRGDNKLRLMRACRNELPDQLLPWLDAVFVLTDESAKFPPLLGTGGNEGSGSYVSTFAQAVVSLLVNRKMDPGVATALFATPAPVISDVAVGHFAPGAIDGPNSSVGFGGGGGANPWDYLLAIEGTLLFAGAASRRIGTDTQGKAAFPFTVDANPVGYGSAATDEDVRAEMWMPEWDRPSALGELKLLLAEGRAQLGRRQARTAVDFARSAVTLGVGSGLAAFHRYAIVKRNGLSYFAADLGRFPVRKVPAARLLDELDPWLAPIRRVADDEKAPPRFSAAVRRIDGAVLDVCRYGADPGRMQAVLRAAGRAEAELANGSKVRADFPRLQPLARLSADWLKECDDGTCEFRLAASVAFLPGVRDRHRPFRMYVEPVAPLGNRRWKFEATAPGVVWSNAALPFNLGAVLIRRLRDGCGEGSGRVDGAGEGLQHPLWGPGRFRPKLADVLAFLDGLTDDQKLAELLWALTAVSPKAPGFRFRKPEQPDRVHTWTDYAVLKLIFLDAPAVRPGTTSALPIWNEPPILALLQAGRLDEAVEAACRRLHASGFPTYLAAPVAGRFKKVGGFSGDPVRARRLLAALLFPLGESDTRRLLERTIRKLDTSPP